MNIILTTICIFVLSHTSQLQISGETKTFVFETPNREEAVYLSSFGISYNRSLSFKVKACQDCNIILMTRNLENTFRIILGGWDNTKLVLRKNGNNVDVLVDKSFVNCDVFKTFWINWETSGLRFGQGNGGNSPILTWSNTEELDIAEIGVYTWLGYTGVWQLNITTGGWGSWYTDGDCSVTCGTGVQRLKRNCSNPLPGSFVTNCVGSSEELRECHNEGCHGGWSSWFSIGDCSTTCGNGIQWYGRICNQPVPADNGSLCPGLPFDSFSCILGDCPAFKWSYFKGINITTTEMKEAMKDELNELKANIAVDPKNTSLSIRRRTSARDERPSAVSVGYAGAILLAIPVILFIWNDCLRHGQHSKKK